MKDVDHALEKTIRGGRLSVDECLTLFEEENLIPLGLAADRVRKKYHPDSIVTFIIGRNINYTNICITKCRFCAFYREKGHPEAYLLTKDEIFKKIEETLELDGTEILLQGGLHPDLTIDYYTDLLRSIKANFDIHIHSFSPPEIVHISRISGLTIEETLQELKNAGLDSLPGGGAEILADDIREHISPNKIGTQDWLKVMEVAHNLKMPTTATMMFGSVETFEHRLKHLEQIRNLQDKTGGFTAFIPWTYQPGHTALGGETTGAFDYLKTLAISRLFLDNIPNIQASWVTQGAKIGQVALAFGANDLGSTMIEENVVRATGVSHRMPKGEMIRVIKDARMIPAQRNTFYGILKIF
ncbi:MAG: cyclic dehypoxanthinyl futalosine synthase [Actinomycetota bacterium]|nr:cyclic dehypoxanthinyl futalosine synthase [Actinomycetota bacterium]